MKRSGPIARKTPIRAYTPIRKKKKGLTAEDRRWQKAVKSLEYCVLCGKYGVEWAHRNQGKGMAIKVSPDQTAALCRECHYEIDNGRDLLRDERRARMDKAIKITSERLSASGSMPK